MDAIDDLGSDIMLVTLLDGTLKNELRLPRLAMDDLSGPDMLPMLPILEMLRMESVLGVSERYMWVCNNTNLHCFALLAARVRFACRRDASMR